HLGCVDATARDAATVRIAVRVDLAAVGRDQVERATDPAEREQRERDRARAAHHTTRAPAGVTLSWSGCRSVRRSSQIPTPPTVNAAPAATSAALSNPIACARASVAARSKEVA